MEDEVKVIQLSIEEVSILEKFANETGKTVNQVVLDALTDSIDYKGIRMDPNKRN